MKIIDWTNFLLSYNNFDNWDRMSKKSIFLLIFVIGLGLILGFSIYTYEKKNSDLNDEIERLKMKNEDIKEDSELMERKLEEKNERINNQNETLNNKIGLINELEENLNELKIEEDKTEDKIGGLKREIDYLKEELRSDVNYIITRKPKEHINAGEVVKLDISISNPLYGDKDDPRDIAVPIWEDGEKVDYFAYHNLEEGKGTSEPEEKRFIYVEKGEHTLKVGENEFSFQVYSPPQSLEIKDVSTQPKRPNVGENIAVKMKVSNPYQREINHTISARFIGREQTDENGMISVGKILIVDERFKDITLNSGETKTITITGKYDNDYGNPKIEIMDKSWVNHVKNLKKFYESHKFSDDLPPWPYERIKWENTVSTSDGTKTTYHYTPSVDETINRHRITVKLDGIK